MFKRLFRKLRGEQLVSFRQGWAWQDDMSPFMSVGATTTAWGDGKKPPKDKRKEVKPKAVMKELHAKKPDVDFSNLDEKIKAIRRRERFMRDDLGLQSTEEKQALAWLQARKKGLKLAAKFKWPVTTQAKVDRLLKKYKLKKACLEQYTLALPEEAIDEMEEYVGLYKKVAKGKADFVLLVSEIEEKTKRKDPILLATSPFGQYFHVLGAWDKEVKIMHELFFKNK